MYILASSQLHIRADLDRYFYDNLVNNVILPYFSFYKLQLMLILLLLVGTVLEDKYYRKRGLYGLRIFIDNEKAYSIMFFTGLILNLCPMYLVTINFLTKIMNFL